MDLSLVFALALMFAKAQGVPILLFANRDNICTVDVTTTVTNSSLVITGLEDAAALDFLYDDHVIYWTDISQGRIKSARLNGSLSVTDVIATGLVSPDGLACDWITRKLYWADSETNRIEASNLDGSMRKVLFWKDLDQPRAIALDPLRGYFYWTDWGETAKIERASMDGLPSSRQIVVSTNVFWPKGLTIDYDDAKIYWTDAHLHYIHSTNLDGSNRREIIPESLPHPFAITVYQGALYWTDWHTKAIYTCNVSDVRTVRMVTDKLFLPMGIHVFDSRRQPKTGRNPCANNNGGCSHLCFLSPWFPFYSCQCPTGVALLSDNRTCDNGPKEMLLLARRTDIRLISLDTSDFLDVVLDIGDVRHAIALDYDPVDQMVYWTDVDLHLIRRASLNGSVMETVVDVEIHSPDGIAVDWLSRNLYWTDAGSDLIQVAKLNGASRKVIISEGLDEPRAIVLDPPKGEMYWSDWGKNSKIEKASMDGTNRTVLVNTSLGWPNGLTIDRSEGKLYWADAELDRIEFVNLDGSGRRILVAEHIPHIFGFALLGDYVYWTDWQRRAIERVNKVTGKQRRVIIDQLPDIMGLTAVSMTTVTESGGCSTNNSGCSHLCLMTPRGPVCACPFAMELLRSDRKTCVVPEALLLYTKQSEIHVVSLDNVDNDIIVPLHELKAVSDIDFDFTTDQIYWADTTNKMIRRAFLNGSMIQTVIRYGLESPDDVAVDWLARNLYWTDSGSGRIEMSRLDGTSRRVVIWKDIKPRELILDPNNGFMYWINALNPTRLERSSLDGSNRQVVITEFDHVNSLTIDYQEQRLYWTNLDTGRIESATVDGRWRHDVVAGLNRPHSLTVYADYVYWTDSQMGSIHRADKTTGLNQSLVLGEIMSPMGVVIFHSSRQTGWSPCGQQVGGCAHLCVTNSRWSETSQYSHHCVCSTHYTLSSNNQTCTAPDLLVLLSQKNSVVQLSIDRGVDDSPDVPLALPPHLLRGIRAFDFNSFDEHIYWIDTKTRAIRKIKLDGSNLVVLLQNTGHPAGTTVPFDLVVDAIDGHVFWSDSAQNTIGVLRFDGSDVGVIVNDTNQRPRSLALARDAGLIFWTNLMISSPTISCSKVDGSGLRTVFSGDFGLLGPIAADAKSKTIYWADLNRGVIESGKFDGTNRQILLRSVSQPVSLVIHDETLYWVDKELKTLERADRRTGQQRQTLKSKLPHVSDVVLVDQRGSRKQVKSGCQQRNLKCSHLCVEQVEGIAHCACPLGLILDVDGQTCVLSLPCATSQVACASGSSLCIPLAWKCDGEVDCSDGSDEASCSSCPGSFSCLSGECVALELQCSGRKDCVDGSDEKGCIPCRESTTDCHNDRTCYTRSQRCDGIVHCWDGFDEVDCPRISESASGLQYPVVVIGILCGVLLVTLIIIVVYLCGNRNRYCLKTQSKGGTQHLSVLPSDLKCSQLCSVASIQSSSQGQRFAQSNMATSGDPPDPYDNHFIDTATLTSFLSHYRHVTFDPPPTPVTSDTSMNLRGSDSVSTKWVKRCRQKHRLVPPPTPCSTDVCDESEPYSADEQLQFLSNTDTGFETDPLYPPPPTPCSQFFPDGYSGPPSPGTSNFRSGSFESSLNFS